MNLPSSNMFTYNSNYIKKKQSLPDNTLFYMIKKTPMQSMHVNNLLTSTSKPTVNAFTKSAAF